jgi:hypothetical protein
LSSSREKVSADLREGMPDLRVNGTIFESESLDRSAIPLLLADVQVGAHAGNALDAPSTIEESIVRTFAEVGK